MRLDSTAVLKRKKAMLHDPLNLENGLKTDALIDSRTNFSAIGELLDQITQQVPNSNFDVNALPQIQ